MVGIGPPVADTADIKILSEDGSEDEVIVIEEDELAKDGDQSQSAGLISVSLERGSSRRDEDVDIVIRQGDLDSKNVQIRITDIKVDQIDIVLAQIRKLLGF
jgi:hypothetical protein